MDFSREYSEFNIESFQILEGYVERFTNSINPVVIDKQANKDETQINSYSFSEGLETEVDIYNKLKTSMSSPASLNNYDVIDNSGNLLYKKNLNFKETIPNLKDAVLEDSINIMNYNNNVYAISGIAIAFLIIGIIVSLK